MATNNNAKLFLSVLAGSMFFAAAYFILLYIDQTIAFPLSVAAGLLFALALYPVLVITEKVQSRRYAQFESTLTEPVFCAAYGNFVIAPGVVKNGNIYFCQNEIHLVSMDQKPYSASQILQSDINKIEIEELQLRIYTKGGTEYLLTTPDAQKVHRALQEKNWL